MRTLLLAIAFVAAVAPGTRASGPSFSASDKAEVGRFKPRVSFDVGGAVAWYATDRLTDMYVELEKGYLAPHRFRAHTGLPAFTAGLRLYAGRSVALRVQGILKRNGSGVVGVSHLGASLLVSPIHTPHVSLWLGGGVARQTLTTLQRYNSLWIDSLGGWLESIAVTAKSQIAYPVDLFLDLHPEKYSRYTILIGIKRIFAPRGKVAHTSNTYVDMDAWVISLGLSAGF